MKKVNKINELKNNTSNKNGAAFLIVILIVIAVISFCIYLYLKTKPVDSVIVNYATKDWQKSHAYTNVLLGPFASVTTTKDSSRETEEFFFSFDVEAGRICIVAFPKGESSRYYQQIEAATYENIEDLPESVKLEGAAKKLDSDIKEIVIEGINELYGENLLDEISLQENFGDYYLAVGKKPNNGENIFLVISILIIWFVVLIVARVNAQKRYYQ